MRERPFLQGFLCVGMLAWAWYAYQRGNLRIAITPVEESAIELCDL